MTTEMMIGGGTPKFDFVCRHAAEFTLETSRIAHSAMISSRDLDVRSELDEVLRGLDYIEMLLRAGDVESAAPAAQDVSLRWQQFAVDHACADDVTDVDLIRWSRISNALVEVEHLARYGMLVWKRRGR